MRQKLKTNNAGFTIIEVLIVLAIAGLIIAVVLFAVPQLQRNGRNTAIKNDANTVAGTISEFESNNDGSVPNSAVAAANSSLLTVSGASGAPTTGKVQGGTTVETLTTGAAPASNAPTVGTISVLFGHKCTVSGAYTAGTTGDASSRSAAIYYSIETSSGTTQKCIDS